MRIPFNKPYLTGQEMGYIADAFSRGHAAGGGHYTRACTALLESLLDVPRVLLTTSCTDALEMAAILLDLGPGDEVIAPSFTFVSTVNAFALRGAKPVFADIIPDTLNLDVDHVARLITDRTRAIVPVHYAGVGCDMQALMPLANAHGIHVVEDNAHGMLARYRGQRLGTFGSLATLSFHETKNISCGEGGALIINNEAWCERAEIILNKGTNRSQFLRGQADKYTWVDIGSSFVPSDILAAFLLAQLEAREDIQKRRRKIWETYRVRLHDWASAHDVRLPTIPDVCEQSYHMFYMVMPSEASRTALMAHLASDDILSVFHYQPLHASQMGQTFGGRVGDCPVAEDMGRRLVRLPFYNDLTPQEQDDVMARVLTFPG